MPQPGNGQRPPSYRWLYSLRTCGSARSSMTLCRRRDHRQSASRDRFRQHLAGASHQWRQGLHRPAHLAMDNAGKRRSPRSRACRPSRKNTHRGRHRLQRGPASNSQRIRGKCEAPSTRGVLHQTTREDPRRVNGGRLLIFAASRQQQVPSAPCWRIATGAAGAPRSPSWSGRCGAWPE